MLKQIKFNDYSKTIITIFTLISFIIILLTINLFNFGFDFTDEAYYLQFITNPFQFNSSIQQFAFVYHSLFKFINFNIPLFRTLNFIAILSLATIFNYLYIKFLSFNKHYHSKLFTLCISFILSLSIIPLYTLWLPTPNYNFLNFKAIFLVLIGLLLVSNKDIKTKNFLLGWILIGLGGALSFLAKPTTAAVLGFLVIFWVYFNKHIKFKFLFISIFLSIFILYLSAIYIDGSINLFINRYKQSLYEDKIAGIHDLYTLFPFYINDLFIYILKPNNILFFISTFFVGFIISKLINNILTFKFFITSLLCLILLYIFINTYEKFRFYAFSVGHLIWAPALGAIVQSLATKKIADLNVDKRLFMSLTIFLGLLPLAYSFGSNNSILITTAFSAYFFLLAMLAILRLFYNSKEWLCKVIGLSVFSLILSAGILYTSLANPYRQPNNLWENNYSISLQKGIKEIFLHPFFGNYILYLQKITEINGFISGNTFIEFSGRLPGVPYVVGGIPPGVAWISSGYKGSQEVFSLNLQKTSCQKLVKTWMLWNPMPFVQSLDPSALLESGIDPNNDFTLIGSVKYPIFFKKNTVKFIDHFILKPKTDYNILLNSCIKSRISN